jgi:flagellar hook protein FlgE
MASTTALLSGLAGLSVNSRRLEVIGNNISNVNTTAFKSNSMVFSSAFSRTLSLGSGPTAGSGGTNPAQIGLGVRTAGTQRSFANGAPNATGVNTHMAVDGDGFFVVERNQEQFYTRSGAFQLNNQNELVTPGGDRVQGYAVDDEFNVVTGTLENIEIPLGSLTVAEATSNVQFSGNLNADGDQATQGSLHRFAALTHSGGTAVTGAELMTAVDGGVFAVGDVITISGVERGQKTMPDASFTVGAASTLDDYAAFLEEALGIVPGGGNDPTDPLPGPEPGGFAWTGAGELELTGNWGELNDLSIEASDFTIVDAGGAAKTNPWVPTKVQDATGESVRTTFVVYDSLGTENRIDLTMVLAGRDGTGTQWRSFMHSADDTDLALHLETGDRGATVPPFPTEFAPLVQFDTEGQLLSPTQVNIEVDRMNTGAQDPLQIALSFDGAGDSVSALSDSGGNSTISSIFQDGSPIGTLSSFSVGDDGKIVGGFTNGLTRDIGQIALAKFTNPEGLVDQGNSLFSVGPNSGTALITEPLEFGTGRVVGGALEESNVDLSQEFTDMILTQTGYTAATRVIDTTNQLLQQLLATGR